jgi:IclR family transcriptional regulator, mhp operon transcriptional activator
VNAVLRGLDVLASVSRHEGAATVGDIYRETGIDKATIVRMLETLVHAGFVVRGSRPQTYEITGKTLLLCTGYDRHRAVGRLVAPVMAQFRTKIGWPSDVALFDHDAMLLVETSREAGPILINRRPGYRAPILATSLGLAYLAHCSSEERTAVLRAEAAKDGPWNDVARDAALSERVFDAIRKRGYARMHPAYSRTEYNNKVTALGVPVVTEGTVLAAMNVLYLRKAVTDDSAVETLLPDLRSTAERIGKLLKGA